MGKSLFKLTSLNLNGIRSATTKGVAAWLAQEKPDCICVQEVKAQAPDVAGKFEELAGLKEMLEDIKTRRELIINKVCFAFARAPVLPGYGMFIPMCLHMYA